MASESADPRPPVPDAPSLAAVPVGLPKAGSPPVVRPAKATPMRVRTQPERDRRPTLIETLWTPTSLKGWAISITLHGLLLLVLGLWLLTPHAAPTAVISAGLAGSPVGLEGGEDLVGGLGLDSALGLPEAGTEIEMVPQPSLSSLVEVPTLEDGRGAPTGASVGLPTGLAEANDRGAGGLGDGFGVARFGTGSERVQGTEVQVGDPQFTLIWEGRADLDLHVIEPGGAHIYWDSRHGQLGGELDVDKREGPGPENIYWVQGKGPEGVYQWYVDYYGPEPFGRFAGPARWRVRVKHKGQTSEYKGVLRTIKDRSKTYRLTVDES